MSRGRSMDTSGWKQRDRKHRDEQNRRAKMNRGKRVVRGLLHVAGWRRGF